MIKSTLAFLLMHLPLCFFAQEVPVKIEFLEEVKTLDEQYSDFIKKDSEHYYTIGERKDGYYYTKEFYLNKYRIDNLKVEERWVYDGFKFNRNKTTLWKTIANEGGIHLLFEAYDKGDDQKFIIYRKLGYNGELNPMKVVAQMNSKKEDSRDFILAYSRDSSKVMIYNDLDPHGEVKFPYVAVFDENFEPIWNRRLENPFRDNEVFRPVDFKLDNEGRLFVLGYQTEKNKSHRKSRVTDQYGVYSVMGNAVKVLDLKSLGKQIHSLGMQPDIDGKLLLVGLCSENGEEHVSGSLYIQVDQDRMEPILRRKEEFGKEFLSNFNFRKYKGIDELTALFKGQSSESERGLESMVYRDFVLHEDSSITVVAERYHKEIELAGSEIVHYCFHDELMPMHFGPSGDLQWLSLIPRHLKVGKDANFLGQYYLHNKEDKLYFIFNDIYTNKERLEKGEEMLLYGGVNWDWGTVAVTLSLENGDWEYHVLSIDKEIGKLRLAPKDVLRLDGNTALGVHRKSNNYKMRFVKYQF